MPKYRMCFEVMTLADAAAFEGLATEMNVPMELTSVEQEPEPVRKSGMTGRTHYAVTPSVVANVKNYIKMYPNASNSRIKDLAGVPHGNASIGRIRNGEYDPGRGRYKKMLAAHAGK